MGSMFQLEHPKYIHRKNIVKYLQMAERYILQHLKLIELSSPVYSLSAGRITFE